MIGCPSIYPLFPDEVQPDPGKESIAHMTITEELIHVNGHAKPAQAQTITLSSGITVKLNRQPGDIMGKAQAAAERELEDSRPAVPTQKMETEPNVWRDIPNENSPEYVAAMIEWRSQVVSATSQKLLLVMERIGLVFEVDHARLADLRETYALLGIELPENDRSAYLGYVIAPTNEDQSRLFMEVFGRGLPQEAQVALHRRMFPRDMEGNAA